MNMGTADAILICAATEPGSPQASADLLWRTKFRVPDPVAYVEHGGKRMLIVSSLEYGRARAEAEVDEVHLLKDLLKRRKEKSFFAALDAFLKKIGAREIRVPDTFPFALGTGLAAHYALHPVRGSMFPDRARKTKEELKAIAHAVDITERGIAAIRGFLALTIVKNGKLYRKEKMITSEILRMLLEGCLYDDGYLAMNTIVACGVQAADPHAIGTGPILAGKPIVIDVFPRSRATFYCADITRTFFKGSPSAPMARMFEAVALTAEKVIRRARPGIDAESLHAFAESEFVRRGYPTSTGARGAYGFIHGLGHGVGLDVHEAPQVGRVAQTLEPGNVVAIEPGLYYPKVRRGIPAGGVRIEDMVHVTEDGSVALSALPRELMWAVLK